MTPGEVKKVERFKELTGGGDSISAEFKGQQKFDFEVTQKSIFAMNQMPEVKGADGAFWNRLLFAKFPDTVPEEDQDKGLAARIVEDEGSVVLNWMLDGLERLREQGHFSGERTTDEKKELCNAFGGTLDRFVRDAVELTGDDDAVVKSDLHQLAQAYADYMDMEPDWNAQRGFTRLLKQEQGIDDMRTRHSGSDNDRDDVYTGIKPLLYILKEIDVDVKHGSIFSSDSDQETLG